MSSLKFPSGTARTIWVVVFIAAAALALAAYTLLAGGADTEPSPSSRDEGAPAQAVPVVLQRVQMRDFEERAVVQGSVMSKNFATVPALVSAPIEKLFVREGDQVTAGETPLFQSESTKIQQAVQVRKQEVVLAAYARREQAANLERVRADFEKAEIDVKRFRRLREQGAVPQDALEQQESRYKQAAAALKYAETVLQSGAERERQTEAALAIAEKELADTLIYAPISGKVSRIIVEEGEMGETGKPVLRIDDTSIVEISAFLPAQYYDRIRPNETMMGLRVNHTDLGERPITFRSPVIDPRLRTFEIKTVIEDPPPDVVPGAIAECIVVLDKRTTLGAPAVAIQTRGGRSVVFSIDRGHARRLEVETGIETDGWIEVKGDGIAEGVLLVVMGQFLLDDGTPVSTEEGAA